MPLTLNLFDLVAAILLAFLLIFGIAYGFKRDDRMVLSIFGIMAVAVICWRVTVWHHTYEAERNAADPSRLYAKYGLEPPPHQ